MLWPPETNPTAQFSVPGTLAKIDRAAVRAPIPADRGTPSGTHVACEGRLNDLDGAKAEEGRGTLTVADCVQNVSGHGAVLQAQRARPRIDPARAQPETQIPVIDVLGDRRAQEQQITCVEYAPGEVRSPVVVRDQGVDHFHGSKVDESTPTRAARSSERHPDELQARTSFDGEHMAARDGVDDGVLRAASDELRIRALFKGESGSDVVARRKIDSVRPGEDIRLVDRGAKRAEPRRGLANAISGAGVSAVQFGLDQEVGSERGRARKQDRGARPAQQWVGSRA